MISQREPDAADPHVRFAERRLETGPMRYRASRRLYPEIEKKAASYGIICVLSTSYTNI
jgi:hypothetical protein